MVLVRNNLVSHNRNVTEVMENTKLNKSKVFDKIVVSLLKTCIKELSHDVVDQVNI